MPDPMPKKPWYRSRKIVIAIVTAVAEVLAVLLADKLGIEINAGQMVALSLPALMAILGIAVEDSKIISAKILAGAADPKP